MGRHLLIIFILAFAGCSKPVLLSKPNEAGVAFDRIILLVDNDRAEKALLSSGLASTIGRTVTYTQEGTTGRIFSFRNGTVELLYLSDLERAQMNLRRFGSDYIRRWVVRPWECALGLGLKRYLGKGKTSMTKAKVYQRGGTDQAKYLMDGMNRITRRPFVWVRNQGLKPQLPSSHAQLTKVVFTVSRVYEKQRKPIETIPGVELAAGRRCMATIVINGGRTGKTLYLPTISPVRIQY